MKKYTDQLINKKPEEALAWAIAEFGPDKIALSSSMGLEDQVLTDMLLKLDKTVEIFTLDTGRLPEETYKLIDETRQKYHCRIKILFPEQTKTAEFTTTHGPNPFYQSIELRKECCQIRKIAPLKEKLKNYKLWVCGLRKDQSVTRADLEVIEWDGLFNLYKLNPLLNWSYDQVIEYIKKNDVPYNKLHDQGYPSIGCEPCTRAVKPGEDIRAGRWWWEQPEQKECGLHLKDGKLVRINK